MNTQNALVELHLTSQVALSLADALDLAEQVVKHELGELPNEQMDETERAELREDLDMQLAAVRSTLLKLGKELPKHFPELSRASRRGQLDELED